MTKFDLKRIAKISLICASLLLVTTEIASAASVGSETNSSSKASAKTNATVTIGFTLEPVSLDITGVAGQAIPQVL
ncbi:MAG: hypothetical protein F2712_04070, partial [Actinobacteria bacterium]|nr:hypothetical protein [Actinomycetota bacterium]